MRLKLNEFKIKKIKINQKHHDSENSIFLCLTEGDAFNIASTMFILTDLGDCLLMEQRTLHEGYVSYFHRLTKDLKKSTCSADDVDTVMQHPLEDEDKTLIKTRLQMFRPGQKEVTVLSASEYQQKGNFSFFVQDEKGERYLVSK